MNIKTAKQQILNAISAYLEKDEFGNYLIPAAEQRPVFLIGAPGIGKTAIMKQISEELGIGLVSYSMTHHTRQSALGLPYITEKTYGGVHYRVSNYSMSEIIASVYDLMADTGLKEGILFLDEINCVSETLAPSMLQFLQFKTFGGHRIPDGWIVVTAGNPPEYNRSVRLFDVVTMDRLKRIDVEPDYDAWKEYAIAKEVHPSILSYLDIKKDHFYVVESSAEGKLFVTARGWVDLSTMIRIYEKKGIHPDYDLISQYLQHPKIARDFSAYYDLFHKYEADYEVDKILAGSATDEIRSRAAKAPFDERLALVGLLLDAVGGRIQHIMREEAFCLRLQGDAKAARDHADIPAFRKEKEEAAASELATGMRSGAMSDDSKDTLNRILRFYRSSSVMGADQPADFLEAYRNEVRNLRENVTDVKSMLTNLFGFVEDVYPNSQEMLILVTEMTVNPYISSFIAHYDCPEYFRHSHEMMFYERNKEIIARLEQLDL